ncbi:hypothetical protein [Salinicola aestuarinus]|uniref:hypothetical protein n=1 Tax=Salinicola aestuarinus TaxID=1949082 RepID=UPI000DA16BF2|nr:hypothetical protein [Salinicola aestuarinus]
MSCVTSRFVFLLISLALALCSPFTMAAPQPFTAHYSLDIDGWPTIGITHTLSRQGAMWESAMTASLKVASGEERSRFTLEGDSVDARDYRSRYALFGIGDDYHLDREQLTEQPDRQAALFMLSRQAPKARCTHPQVSPCELVYQDHKGRRKTLDYRVTDQSEVTAPAGHFPGVTVDTWDPEKRDRHLFLTFHREHPGLLLGSHYVRDGEQTSQLTLDAVSLSDESAPEQRLSESAPADD